jgi:hypothetical protein
MRAMQMPTFASAFQSVAGFAGRAAGYAWPKIVDFAKWVWFPTGSRYLLTGPLGNWLAQTAATFSLRWGFSFAQGLLTNNVLEGNVEPVISSLRHLGATAASFNGSLGGQTGQAISAGVTIGAGHMQGILDEMTSRNLVSRPLTTGQLGAFGNLLLATENIYKFHIQLGMLNQAISTTIIGAYNALSAQDRAQVDAKLGLQGGLRDIEFRPNSFSVINDAFFGTLKPHQEVDLLRIILIELDSGNSAGASADLAELVRRMSNKYGEVYVNGIPR